MAKTGKRYFTTEFKREAVALWEIGGRTQSEVAGELGIMPGMLRRWQRVIGAGAVMAAAQPPASRYRRLQGKHRCRRPTCRL